MVLPWLGGVLLLYGTLSLYFQRLTVFLNYPNDRTGSSVLGIVAGGVFLLLFLHCMICTTVTSVFLDKGEKPVALRVRRREWRLYAAHLRILPFFVPVIFLLGHVRDIVPYELLQMPLAIAVIVLAIFILSRICFLMTPISIIYSQGAVLRRSWRLSSGNAVIFFLLSVVLIAPGVFLELCAEAGLRTVGSLPANVGSWPLAAVIALYTKFLPAMVCVISIVYLISTILFLAGQVAVYRQLASEP